MFLGNLQFHQVKEFLGYELNEEDKKVWNKYHNDKANLDGMNSCFHVFLFPTCIVVKGNDANIAIKKIFTPDKIVEPKGEFRVYVLKA